MKESYIAPVAELICFRPLESLATLEDDSYEDIMSLFGDDGDIGSTTSDTEFPWP